MGEMKELSYEAFMSMAKTLGLDTEGPHMKELFAHLQEVLPGLKRIEELDLTGIELTIPFIIPRQ